MTRFSARFWSLAVVVGYVGSSLAVLTLSGCNPAVGSAKKSASSPQATAEAKKLLDDMAANYLKLNSYADAGKLTLAFELNGEPRRDEFDYSTTFARPNKLRLHCYGTVVVSDGKQLRASVRDLAPQVLTIEAPAKLDETALISDPIIADSLVQGGPAGGPIVPSLLTNANLLPDLLKTAKPPALLEPIEIEKELCDQVQIEFTAPKNDSQNKDGDNKADAEPGMTGKLIFCIDRKLKVLRRIEFPIHPQTLDEIAKNGGKNATLIAEFTGVQTNHAQSDKAFAFEPPAGATLVKRFVRAFPPEQPSNLLGKQVGDFTFGLAKNDTITRDSLKDKVVVFDFWFASCEPCRMTAPLVQQVYEKYKDNKDVSFYAVNVADDSATVEQLEKTLKDWGSTLPLARDMQQQAEKVFSQTGMPCLMVLGKDGRLQYFEAGLNPNLPNDLPAVLDRVLKGEDTFEDVTKKYEIAKKDYEERIRLATLGTNSPDEPPKVEIAAATQPTKLKLTKRWTTADLKGPVGNVLIVPGEEQAKIYVHDGYQAVAEINKDGKLLKRHDLQIPEKQVVSFVRTAVDAAGKRYFVGFANAMPQLHCYDEEWKRLFSYPEGDQALIADVQLADFVQPGQVAIHVGYWDNAGVQGVSLDGKRLWASRAVQNPLHLAAGGKKDSGGRTTFVVNGSEALFPVGGTGQLGTPITIANRALEWLTAADLSGDGTTKLCGISAHLPDASVILGLDETGREQWSYRLVKGIPQQPVERIVAGKLQGQGVWLVVGPDGSLHVLTATGELLEKFNYGADISGVGTVQIDGQDVLLISSKQGFEALTVE